MAITAEQAQALFASGFLSPTSQFAQQNNLTPIVSYPGLPSGTSPTTPYDPSLGEMTPGEGWGNNYTYRIGHWAESADKYNKYMQGRSLDDPAFANPVMQDFLKNFKYAGDTYTLAHERLKTNPIIQQLNQLQSSGQSNYGSKSLSAANNIETIAGKLAQFGIDDLNQIGVASISGKPIFYSKLTGQALPDRIGYTTFGDGMMNYTLQAAGDGSVIPIGTWKDTSTNVGGLALGALGAFAAPWAIPAISSGLGIGAAAAGGLYGAGTGALTSAASGGNILTGALTGGLGGALGGGLLGDITGGAATTGTSSLGTTGNVMDDILGGSITSGSGASNLINAAPIGTTIGGISGGFLNPALAGGLAGAAGSAASGGLGDFPFQSPSSISPVGETPALNNTGTGLSTVGSTPPDLGTGMITSPEGLSGLVNSPPIGTTLGAATPGTTGGFLNPILGGAPLATTAAAGGLAQGASSVTDFLSNLFSKGADKFMENPLQNTVGILSALSSTSQGKDLADQLKALMNQGLSQSDPFGSQRAQYAAKLKQTYDNPNTYLGSEEYKGISRKRLEALERADAAQGRRSQYGARAEKMYEFDQENLMKERTMLAQLAGSGIQPGQVGNILSTLGAGSANAQVNANGQLYALLASMVKGS